MKTTKIFLILLAAAVIFAPACDELLGDLLKFDSEWYPLPFTIEPTDAIGDLVFTTGEFDANLDSILNANGVSNETLKSARVSDARVTILTAGYNFDPVTSIELFIETPNLGSTRLAWLDSVPRGVTTVDLDLNTDDMQDYLLENMFKLTASGTLVSKVDHTVDLLAEIRFVLKGGLTQ